MSGGTNGSRANGTSAEEPVTGYLSLVEIENIRSIASLRWRVEPEPGWNVVLGDNGAGKSTFLRAVAYCILPFDERMSLRIPPTHWMRHSGLSGKFEIKVSVRDGATEPLCTALVDHVKLDSSGTHTRHTESPNHAMRPLFSAGFGPFRRFTGGDPEYEGQFDAFPRVARVVSLFDERVSLSGSLAWLKLLRFKELEEDVASGSLIASLRSFVNQPGFLPDGARLGRITSDRVYFTDGNGAEVAIEELSDGYRSILSLILELIRQLASHYGPEHVFDPSSKTVIAPGIVLIDEVDAHLHPSWQRRIGLFLRACFPAIQFIVTTHSPLVCQAAEVGTVFQLPRPGTSKEGRLVTGAELDRLLYGDLVEAYETEAMGGIGRSDRAKELLGTFAALNRKAIDEGLSDEERKEQRRLRAIFPTSSETLP